MKLLALWIAVAVATGIGRRSYSNPHRVTFNLATTLGPRMVFLFHGVDRAWSAGN
jgi:hypothetical protein